MSAAADGAKVETRDGFPFAFACKRSGNCCAIPGGFVRVGDDDVQRIAAHLAITPAAFRSRYVQPDGERLKEGLGGRCAFLQDGAEASCAIYPVRPQRCRDWPFWDELRDDPSSVVAARRICPGIVASSP